MQRDRKQIIVITNDHNIIVQRDCAVMKCTRWSCGKRPDRKANIPHAICYNIKPCRFFYGLPANAIRSLKIKRTIYFIGLFYTLCV